MGNRTPAIEYLVSCSSVSVAGFELSCYNRAANLRKQLYQVLEDWIREEVDARLAGWVRQQQKVDRVVPGLCGSSDHGPGVLALSPQNPATNVMSSPHPPNLPAASTLDLPGSPRSFSPGWRRNINCNRRLSPSRPRQKSIPPDLELLTPFVPGSLNGSGSRVGETMNNRRKRFIDKPRPRTAPRFKMKQHKICIRGSDARKGLMLDLAALTKLADMSTCDPE